jgi:arylsulfatase
MAVPVGGAVTRYLVDLARYPPQFKVFFASNNPPLYDLVPQLKELMRPAAGGNGGTGAPPGVPGMPSGVQGATGKR